MYMMQHQPSLQRLSFFGNHHCSDYREGVASFIDTRRLLTSSSALLRSADAQEYRSDSKASKPRSQYASTHGIGYTSGKTLERLREYNLLLTRRHARSTRPWRNAQPVSYSVVIDMVQSVKSYLESWFGSRFALSWSLVHL